ncbi:MAG: epoxyqueuosine reductase [Eggerthellaceae bacterium]|nr:epoxyqueuosine reductase [Eggerthellaceae bacterium]
MDTQTLTDKIKWKALELGYVRCGITTADDFPDFKAILQSRTHYGFFYGGNDNPPILAGASPKTIDPQAKSIISLIYSYGNIDFPEQLIDVIGRCYQARCYSPPANTVNGQRLELFRAFLKELGINELGPYWLPDRAIAVRSGVATYGKNNLIYADEYGSFIIATSVLVDVELAYDSPKENVRPCPDSCTRCIDACPTGAITGPGDLNPDRCILRNQFSPDALIFEDVFDLIGTRIHGCDACQVACPRNHHALKQTHVKDPLLERIAAEFSLEKLLFCDDDYYDKVVHPIMYNYISDVDLFRRNAAIAMGNSGDASYIPALERAVEEGSESVRAHALRALEKLRSSQAAGQA